MGRRGKILCSLALTFLAGLITVYLVLPALPLSSDGSPVHEDRSLAEWTDIYVKAFWAEPTAENNATKDQAASAIRAIGTNGLPHLIKWMEYEEPEKKLAYRYIINRSLESVTEKWYIRDSRRDRADASVYALIVLGRDAESALSDLTRLFLDPVNSAQGYRAAQVLRKMGEPATPAFQAALTNESRVVKLRALHSVHLLRDNADPLIPLLVQELAEGKLASDAARALGGLRLQAEITIPALIKALNSEDKFTRNSAVHALGRFGPQAKSAVPALIKAREERDISSTVDEVLKEIAPDYSPDLGRN